MINMQQQRQVNIQNVQGNEKSNGYNTPMDIEGVPAIGRKSKDMRVQFSKEENVIIDRNFSGTFSHHNTTISDQVHYLVEFAEENNLYYNGYMPTDIREVMEFSVYYKLISVLYNYAKEYMIEEVEADHDSVVIELDWRV